MCVTWQCHSRQRLSASGRLQQGASKHVLSVTLRRPCLLLVWRSCICLNVLVSKCSGLSLIARSGRQGQTAWLQLREGYLADLSCQVCFQACFVSCLLPAGLMLAGAFGNLMYTFKNVL